MARSRCPSTDTAYDHALLFDGTTVGESGTRSGTAGWTAPATCCKRTLTMDPGLAETSADSGTA